MKFNKTAIKSISATVVLAQLSMAMQPLLAATREDKGAGSPLAQAQLKQMQALQRSMEEGKAAQAAAALSPADRASTNLARVEELVRDLRYLGEEGDTAATKPGQEQVRAIGQTMKAKVRALTAEQKAQRQSRRTALWGELKGLLAQQGQDQGAVRSEFAQTRKMLIERKLPAVIVARHDEAVAKFEQRVAQFNLVAAKAADGDEAALAQLTAFFDENPTKRRAAPVDPKNLPWRTPEPTKRMPAETQTAWFQNLYGREGTRLAQVGNNLSGLTFITPPDAGSAPTEADLAETPETQRTAVIVAKATELGNNPVAIQNWVRNNVEWVPTWGAIQSAEDTLNKKRGNAIDIASLEIALLRAAKIPARYQFGTIEVPADQVMNWVGGVSKPEAAQQLLGQGGIANRGLIEGGKISKIRMEHAWVQAYVNWVPSRGAKQGSALQHPNPLAQRNAWVPLDPSFKQYQFVAGLNLLQRVPLDIQSLISEAAGANTGGDYAVNLKSMSVERRLDDYQSALKEYVQKNAPTAGVGEVAGRAIIPSITASLLGMALPYGVVQLGQGGSLPESLVHKVTLKLFSSRLDQAEGSPRVASTLRLSQLGAGRLFVRYVPASDADRQLIANAKQAGQKYLPAYLIKMAGELRLNGQLLAQLPLATMGDVQWWTAAFDDPTGLHATEDDFKLENSVGDEIAFGLNVSGIKSSDIQAKITQVANDSATETLFRLGLYYWGFQDTAHDEIAKTLGAVVVRLPSIGMFAQSLKKRESWGVVRQAYYAGRTMDVRRSISALSFDTTVSRLGYMRTVGALDSYIEGAVFDLALSHELGTSSSAVSVLNEANRIGQKIYYLTPENSQALATLAASLPSDVVQQLQSALGAGMNVQVHAQPVQNGNWKGVGLVITDPDTGSGAYLLNGVSNGGEEDVCSNNEDNQPTSQPLIDWGMLAQLFFYLALIALAAWIIGTGGLGGAVVAAVSMVFVTTGTANAMTDTPVTPLGPQTSMIWNAAFAGVYGPWPVAAATVLPQACSEPTRIQLHDVDQYDACKVKPVKCPGDVKFCPEIQERASNRANCIKARLNVMQVCFPGGAAGFGDAKHWNHLREELNGLNKCLCEGSKNGCQIMIGP